jgi:tRNA(Ile)-lysidine synthase
MSKSLPDIVQQAISKHSMLSAGEHVLVALSGGADSVCLLLALHKLAAALNLKLSAAYIDHGFRPDEIPAEIEFCEKLCEKLAVPFFVRKIDPAAFAKQEGLGKQEASRELRYKALIEIAAENGCNRIALAHNADDLAETILMHLVRGSGPLGLAGIPPVRKPFIRPLLDIPRKDIEEFVRNEGTGFVTDSSNMTDDYLRNRIRHSVIPILKNINKDFIGTVSRNADILRQEERYLEIQVTKDLMKLISRKTDSRIELFLLPMEALDVAILRRVLRRAVSETRGLRRLGLTNIEDLIKLVKSGRSGDRLYLPDSIRAIKSYSTLILTAEKTPTLGEYTVNGPCSITIREASRVISASLVERSEVETFGDGLRIACLDADRLEFPLTIRSRKSGDFFYPLGLGKRKKLQDFFVDEKIPRDERGIVPLLVSNNEICLIIGRRVDDRYKVNDNTKRVLRLELKPSEI